MKKLFCLSLILTVISGAFYTNSADSYAQDPVSCTDKRLQFPTYPPCVK